MKDAEKQLSEQRERDVKQFEETSRVNKKTLEQLTEQLSKKESEITELKMAMLQLSERETARMRQLEREAQNFRDMMHSASNNSHLLR